MIDYSVWLEAGAILKTSKNFDFYEFVKRKQTEFPNLELNEDAFHVVQLTKDEYFITNNFFDKETGHCFYDLKTKKENFEIKPEDLILWKENFIEIFAPYKELIEKEFGEKLEVKVLLLNDIW